MHRQSVRFLSLVALAALAPAARAADLHVPAGFATIQLAVNAASPGDTILVAPGHYVERVDLLGKLLVVEGTGGAAATILDGGGLGPVLRANGAEPAGTTIRGLTITGGGTGELVTSPGPFGSTTSRGAGVFVGPAARLDLVDCAIADNDLDHATLVTWGGGLAVEGGRALLLGCTLSGNSADRGGAIASGSSAHLQLIDCTVSGNALTTGTNGAAIDVSSSKFVAAHCAVQDNLCSGLNGNGVGPWRGCSFSGNAGWGATLFSPVGVDLYDCEFLGNALGGASMSGSTINTEHYIKRCVFADGDTLKGDGFVTPDACSFDGAHVQDVGGATITVSNSIVRTAPPFVLGGSASFSYCNVQGGAPGVGNIDADPLWTSAATHDYSLLPTSPCIDTANPSALLDPDFTRADMGPLPVGSLDTLGGGIEWGSLFTEFPRLAVQGTLVGGSPLGLRLDQLPASKPIVLFAGLGELRKPFKGGVLWPSPDLVLSGLVSDAAGRLWLETTWPVGVPSGTTIELQAWFKAATAVKGAGASNGVRAITP